jgi:hypothetical protein
VAGNADRNFRSPRRCLGDALDEVEGGVDALKRGAVAWAEGDVPSALAAPRGFAACQLLLSGGAEFWSRTIDQETAAIAQALAHPGHSVAVFPLRAVLAKDGILERLRARGFVLSGGP